MSLRQTFTVSRRISTVFMLAVLTTLPALAEDSAWRLDLDNSVFAVVTHKAGLGARLAHNHLIAADLGSGATINFAVSSDSLSEATFSLEARSDALQVDDSTLQKRWYPRLEELGILDEAFVDIADKDQAKIRKSMLGKSQLNAAQHPTIRAHVESITKDGDGTFPYELQLALTVVGKKVIRLVRAQVVEEGDQLRIEAHGTFAFTEFGIEPYSALLGAVKNDDVFHVFVHVEAER